MVGGLDLALRFCADISCFLDKISYNALCDKNPNITKSQQLKEKICLNYERYLIKKTLLGTS